MADSESGVDRWWWILGLAFVTGWCVYLYFFGPTLSSSNVPTLDGTSLSRPADYDWPLEDPEGKPTSFAQFRGKAVFLNLWATWCGPCIAELPAIARLAASPGLDREKVAFVCVSLDQDVDAFRQFVATRAKGWPMTFLHTDPAVLPSVFGSDGIPATFLIAPDGRVAASVVGGADWDDPSIAAFLQRLAHPRPRPDAKPASPAPAPGPAATPP